MNLSELASLFPHAEPVDRGAATVDARMVWGSVPAKCAVYLLAGGDGGEEPLLLATVGNLRAALQRRVDAPPPDGHTKRIDYAQICTRVHWRIVDSPFAANWWYWRSARTLFPDRFKELIAWHPAWWLAVDEQAKFPKLRRTQDLSDPAPSYAGPIRDRTAAGKLIDTVEDLFDLCRYHHILVQAPDGRACAYKEMGKCPAPCDGSVPVEWYHGQMKAAFRFVRNEAGFREEWRQREIAAMKGAAGALAFEQAARIKQRIERANVVWAEPYGHMGRLEDFAWLALQPGHGRTRIEPWVIVGGRVECLPQFRRKEIASAVEGLMGAVRELAAEPVRVPVEGAGVEQMGIVAHHLFRGERDAGMYLRMREVLAGGAEFVARAAERFFERKTEASGLAEQASDKAASSMEVPEVEVVPDNV